jgi:hypothetical protein
MFCVTISVAAQQPHDTRISQLAADLMPLRTASGSTDDRTETRRVMAHFVSDINGFYSKVFVTGDLAFALTNTLTGKNLSEDTLTPLMDGILSGFDIASRCSVSPCDLLKSVPYRATIERTFSALISLGVNISDAQRVVVLLFKAANRVINPVVRPIPPARPLQ